MQPGDEDDRAIDNLIALTARSQYGSDAVLRTLSDVELITADYVPWFNQQRLMHRLGRVPPAEAESRYHANHVTDQPVGSQNPESA